MISRTEPEQSKKEKTWRRGERSDRGRNRHTYIHTQSGRKGVTKYNDKINSVRHPWLMV